MAESFNVVIRVGDQSHSFVCSSEQTLLSAAEASGLDLPQSCCAGVCTTCAARVESGSVDQPDAMGAKEELRQAGFALLCVAKPLSDLQLLAGQEDELYQVQFGQYQK